MSKKDSFLKLTTDLVTQLKELGQANLKPSKKLRLYTGITKEADERLKYLKLNMAGN